MKLGSELPVPFPGSGPEPCGVHEGPPEQVGASVQSHRCLHSLMSWCRRTLCGDVSTDASEALTICMTPANT